MAVKVVLAPCPNYDQENIDVAIGQGLESLGGFSTFVKPGQKVLIKPNALLGETPEHAVTTHPAIIAAVVKAVVALGATAWVGDSPGNVHSNVAKTMEKTGLLQATEENGGRLVYFQQDGVVEIKASNPKLPIRISKLVLEADVIINLPKLKTHGLTLYTGAIKNMFGTVPGFHKTAYHTAFPKAADFAAAMVDIFAATKPTLNIMDAIIGMEGNGPNSGTPRKMGLLIASTDAVALDAIGAYLIGYEPERILTTAIAAKRNLGEINLTKIEIAGPPLSQYRQPDWKKSFSSLGFIGDLPEIMIKLLSPILSQVTIFPTIDQTKCTKCLVCVNNCPAKTINYDKQKKVVTIDKKDCISCFCCHELCEYQAVKLDRSWLVRMLNLG
jgi:uncharacterized protein (DUF362 family)/NAD-dependent dihydropyrimidine dehydrogenase PreA subunit